MTFTTSLAQTSSECLRCGTHGVAPARRDADHNLDVIHMKLAGPLLIVPVVCIALACDLPHQEVITRDQFGDAWPFTVDSGRLYCQQQGNHVVFIAGGLTYALDVSAREAATRNGYHAIDPIVRRLPPEPVRVKVERIPEGRRREAFAEAARCDGASTFESGNCRAAILTSVGITEAELEQIVHEGIARTWPPFPPRRADIQPIISRGLALCER